MKTANFSFSFYFFMPDENQSIGKRMPFNSLKKFLPTNSFSVTGRTGNHP